MGLLNLFALFFSTLIEIKLRFRGKDQFIILCIHVPIENIIYHRSRRNALYL